MLKPTRRLFIGPTKHQAARKRRPAGRVELIVARVLRQRTSRTIATAFLILLCCGPMGYASAILDSLENSSDFESAEHEGLVDWDRSWPEGWWFVQLRATLASEPARDTSPFDFGSLQGRSLGIVAGSELNAPISRPTSSDSKTLQQVLRSLLTESPRVVSATGAPNGEADRNQEADDGDRSLSQRLLQSEIAGAALQAIVDLKTIDEHGITFSVWGMGQFELSANGSHDVTISELSSGWSAVLVGDSNQLRSAAELSGAPEGAMTSPPRSSALRLAVNWFLNFLASPIGMLLALLFGLVVIVRALIEIVGVVRATPSRHRRAFRKARRAYGTSAASPERERRHTVRRRRRSRRRFGNRASQS